MASLSISSTITDWQNCLSLWNLAKVHDIWHIITETSQGFKPIADNNELLMKSDKTNMDF